ncbi:MAG TPA: DoxX family membrane protein [Anaerolineae bacterium]|nr:DoxX family membrane protein [Anaerolineae bacterium]HXV98212.1 DoxX family membrane protein [Anaerolineae bacterium]
MLVARLIYALPLLYQGVTNLGQLDRLTAKAREKGLPASKVTTAGAMIWLTVGTLAIIFNFQSFIGGLMVAAFLVFTGFTIHNFWTVTDPATRKQDQLHFLKNLSLAGAALVIAAMQGG